MLRKMQEKNQKMRLKFSSISVLHLTDSCVCHDSFLSASGLSQANTPQTPNGQSHQFGVSLSHSLSPYVGQSMCIDIFSVYGSPESRIGDHPRNRLSHFNAP